MSLRQDEGPVVGFDVGGTAIKAGWLSGTGQVIREISRPTPAFEGPDQTVRTLLEMLDELSAEIEGFAGHSESRVPGRSGGPGLPVGIGCAGLVDGAAGLVRLSPNLPAWRDVRLADRVEVACGIRPFLLNDANAFLLAEARLGSARGWSSAIGLTMGTGIGGGILLGGRLWTGARGFAGEPGHVTVDLDGPPCACGRRGCLEALVGTHGLRARFARLGGASSAEEAPTPAEIARRARKGDRSAMEAWIENGRILGLALGALANLFDPEGFVIGGGFVGAADLWLPPATETLSAAALHPEGTVPELRAAALGPSAGWIGAALAARENAAGGT